jgi:predicted nucleic acid-binding protein
MVFVDSNVPMYVAGRDHPLRGPSVRFLARARAGEIEICTSTEVLQEVLYRYAALKRPDLAGSVYDLFVQLCPVVWPVTLADTDRARQMIADVRGTSVRDAIHAAVMLNHDVTTIATFDAGFDRIAGVKRIPIE